MRNENEANRAIRLYADSVRRVCLIHLKSHSDVDDIFQEVFLKYILYEKDFESDEHEKAWIIRVAINACKDVLKSFFRKNVFSFDDMNLELSYLENNDKELLNAVLGLPQKYRDVIYLFYYEGYSAVEIAKILNKKENTIYTWLSRAKKELKIILGGDQID